MWSLDNCRKFGPEIETSRLTTWEEHSYYCPVQQLLHDATSRSSLTHTSHHFFPPCNSTTLLPIHSFAVNTSVSLPTSPPYTAFNCVSSAGLMKYTTL